MGGWSAHDTAQLDKAIINSDTHRYRPQRTTRGNPPPSPQMFLFVWVVREKNAANVANNYQSMNTHKINWISSGHMLTDKW